VVLFPYPELFLPSEYEAILGTENYEGGREGELCCVVCRSLTLDELMFSDLVLLCSFIVDKINSRQDHIR